MPDEEMAAARKPGRLPEQEQQGMFGFVLFTLGAICLSFGFMFWTWDDPVLVTMFSWNTAPRHPTTADHLSHVLFAIGRVVGAVLLWLGAKS